MKQKSKRVSEIQNFHQRVMRGEPIWSNPSRLQFSERIVEQCTESEELRKGILGRIKRGDKGHKSFNVKGLNGYECQSELDWLSFLTKENVLENLTNFAAYWEHDQIIRSRMPFYISCVVCAGESLFRATRRIRRNIASLNNRALVWLAVLLARCSVL